MEIIILLIVLLICLITDIRCYKILNVVTIPTIVFGVMYNILTKGSEGILFSGNGFIVGIGLLIIPYFLGGMGAGDVKLMAAIGALMGASFVFYSFIYTALIGGFIAIFLLIKSNGFNNTIKSVCFNFVFLRGNLGAMIIAKDNHNKVLFPYGIAISLGTVCTLIWGGF